MFDTVELRQKVLELDFRKYSGWEWTEKKGMKRKYKTFAITDSSKLTITLGDNYGRRFVWASTSLPKLICGNNVQMISKSEFAGSLERISNLVSNYTDLEFDAANADVTRIDVCQNWEVTDTQMYLDAAKYASYPRTYLREINRFRGVPSVYFGRRNYNEIYLYDKSAETMRRDRKNENRFFVKNQLRLEHSICKGKVRALFGSVNAKDVIDEKNYEKVMREDLKNLGLDEPIRGRSERFTSLRKHCIGRNGNLNKRKLKSLFSTLSLIDEFESNDRFVLSEVMNKSTYYRHKRQLQAAGVWMSAANRQTLPPLSIPSTQDLEDEVLEAEYLIQHI